VQAAVYAKANGTGVICLSAQSFAEDVTVDNPLTIVGAGAGTSVRTFSVQGTTLYLSKLKVTSGSTLEGTYGIVLGDSSQANVTTLVLSQADVTGGKGTALWLFPECAQRTRLAVVDSYLHDSFDAMILQPWGSSSCSAGAPTTSIIFTNDTVTNNQYGIYLQGTGSTSAYLTGNVTIENTLFSSNSVAAIRAPDSSFTVGGDYFPGIWAYDHNAFFGNGATYVIPHEPTTGSGDVTTDPQLDTGTSPPTPNVGSPLKGTADSAVLPALDFFGHSRTSPDIGAVNAH
jgi:hypothetical protein